MLYAEWSGKRVKILEEHGRIVRQFCVRYDVVGVQVSGDDPLKAYVAITMSNGKTDLYEAGGRLVRKGM